MLRFKVIRLTKEGFVQVKGPIKIVILVPFVLRIVYFIVYRRLCKVELRTEGRIRYWSLDFQNKIVTLPHLGRSVQCHLARRQQHGPDNQTSAKEEKVPYF